MAVPFVAHIVPARKGLLYTSQGSLSTSHYQFITFHKHSKHFLPVVLRFF